MTSQSVTQTRGCGAAFAESARPGAVFALVGDLGSGKTEFVRGFVARLAPGAVVRSPTFSLVNTYDAPGFPIHHFDFYRLSDPGELAAIGFEDYLYGGGVCCIEWADLFMDALPPDTRTIGFTDTDEQTRIIDWTQPNTSSKGATHGS